MQEGVADVCPVRFSLCTAEEEVQRQHVKEATTERLDRRSTLFWQQQGQAERQGSLRQISSKYSNARHCIRHSAACS